MAEPTPARSAASSVGGAGGRRVDVEDPGLCRAREPLGGLEVGGKYCGGQPVVDAVRACQGLVEGGEVEQRGDGTERLVACQSRLVVDVLEECWRHEVALTVAALAAGEQPRALAPRLLDGLQ